MKLMQPKTGTVALLMSLLAACASPAPNLDTQFGKAVNAAKAQQTINPDASKNRDPVAGIDGAAAKESVDRYQSTFKSPPPATSVINIGIGASGGGGR